jgi:hypothetical protein
MDRKDVSFGRGMKGVTWVIGYQSFLEVRESLEFNIMQQPWWVMLQLKLSSSLPLSSARHLIESMAKAVAADRVGACRVRLGRDPHPHHAPRSSLSTTPPNLSY